MKQEQIMKVAFIVSIVSMLVAAALKIMHVGPGMNAFFGITIIASIIWTALALVEVYSSTRLDLMEKIMWTVGFVAFNMLGGILYFLSGRQRVIDRRSHFNIQN